ncbi:MAG TPA: zinc-binding dehydrogenase [Burkholderiaceae bacterium]|nr:zinc-binding dehydrogenase [Burkholderiaceae bacterium]
MSTLPTTGLQLRSTIRRSGELEITLVDQPVAPPGDDEVLIRVEASPINPSDQGLLFGAADMSTARQTGSADRPTIVARVPEQAMAAMAGRLDQSMPVGNEGAGTVVAAGSSPAAQALLGKVVATLGGAMYSQYRVARVQQCLVLPPGATAVDGASCFVNPLTALGMVETMRRDGHTALVHTAAASNLGQMLNRICQKDGIPLVNIVRSAEQVALLRGQGAQHVCDSSSESFRQELVEALAATGATVAFDAIGGGRLATQILSAMEAAISRNAKEYSRYGSSVHKQVYVYGGLDRGPTIIDRDVGMAWGVGGWLLTPFLQRIGPAAAQKLRERVAAELKTTFASRYTRSVSLPQALQLDAIAAYGKRSTGEKYLITPNA